MTTTALLVGIYYEREFTTYITFKKSVDSQKFCQFALQLRNKYGITKLALLINNLAVKKSRVVTAQLNELAILPLFNVPQSP